MCIYTNGMYVLEHQIRPEQMLDTSANLTASFPTRQRFGIHARAQILARYCREILTHCAHTQIEGSVVMLSTERCQQRGPSGGYNRRYAFVMRRIAVSVRFVHALRGGGGARF